MAGQGGTGSESGDDERAEIERALAEAGAEVQRREEQLSALSLERGQIEFRLRDGAERSSHLGSDAVRLAAAARFRSAMRRELEAKCKAEKTLAEDVARAKQRVRDLERELAELGESKAE